jgi:hypothetical protein
MAPPPAYPDGAVSNAFSTDPFTLAGLAGAAVVIAAYFANQMRWLSAEDWRFPLLNLVGAGLILASFATQWNFPSVVIELFWIAISLVGLVRAVSG